MCTQTGPDICTMHPHVAPTAKVSAKFAVQTSQQDRCQPPETNLPMGTFLLLIWKMCRPNLDLPV